ncbi:unnamed protein product [Brassica rapa]|uniref:Uncharacterized protein n=1 Tax=Brassica campestris TaxID=3711 RepID=A0A8D9CV00_BRACM|nr:unnamed protein product [Brassica rapa]
MCVRQHTRDDVCGCPPAHTGRPWLSVCTYVAVHQYTYQHVGPWTQHAGPSCGLFGCLFSTHRTSVGVRQHTQDVCGCLWLSVSTQRTSVAICVCQCVSVSTHRTSMGVRQHTMDVHCCLCVSYSSHRTSVAVHQYTYQHVVHTGRPWVSANTHRTSVAVHHHTQDVGGCPCVSVSTHMTTLALPVDCSGDFGPRGLSVQYTQEVCGCLPAHAGRRQWLSVYARVCPCVSVSTHMTSVAVHQYTYQHAGPWTEPAGPSRGLFG